MVLDPAVAALIARGASEPRVSQLSAVEARRLKSSIRTDLSPFAAKGLAVDINIPSGSGCIPARLYRPDGAGNDPLPLILYFHGGGFVICDLDTHDGIARNLCGGSGAALLSVAYRLAPEHPFPAGLDDAVASYRHALQGASELGVLPEKIVLCGDSAGGNLAAATALRLRDEGVAIQPAGQVLLYPVLDHPSRGTASYRECATGFGLTAADMAWFWSHYCPQEPEVENAYAMPLRAEKLSDLPPAYIAYGEYDVLRDEAKAYAGRLREAGLEVEARQYAGLNHNFFANFNSVPAVEAAYGDLFSWLQTRFPN